MVADIARLAEIDAMPAGGAMTTGRRFVRMSAIRDQEDLQKAAQCEMCKEIAGGAACVCACPTGAALRVSPEKVLDYASGVEV